MAIAKRVRKKANPVLQKNLYVVGDVHGCYSEFLKLEQKILEHILADESPVDPDQLPEDFLVVSVGDLIDRGPDSAWVLEHFCKGAALGTHASVLGNHEAIFLSLSHYFRPEIFRRAKVKLPPWIKTIEEEYGMPRKIRSFHGKGVQHFAEQSLHHWLKQGGLETLQSLGWEPSRKATWKLPSPILKWMCSLPAHIETSTAFISHALITREDATELKKFDYAKILKSRGAFGSKGKSKTGNSAELNMMLIKQVERTLWHRDLPTNAPLQDKWHFSGHTPVRDVVVDSELQIVRLDTGCPYGNRLTAFHVRSGSILEVPSETKWAPETPVLNLITP